MGPSCSRRWWAVPGDAAGAGTPAPPERPGVTGNGPARNGPARRGPARSGNAHATRHRPAPRRARHHQRHARPALTAAPGSPPPRSRCPVRFPGVQVPGARIARCPGSPASRSSDAQALGVQATRCPGSWRPGRPMLRFLASRPPGAQAPAFGSPDAQAPGCQAARCSGPRHPGHPVSGPRCPGPGIQIARCPAPDAQGGRCAGHPLSRWPDAQPPDAQLGRRPGHPLSGWPRAQVTPCPGHPVPRASGAQAAPCPAGRRTTACAGPVTAGFPCGWRSRGRPGGLPRGSGARRSCPRRGW